MRKFPVIDYKSHPAFKSLASDTNDLSARLLPLFQELDEVTAVFDQSITPYSQVEIERFYNEKVSGIVESGIKKMLVEEYHFNAVAKEIMLKALPGFICKLIDQSIYKNIRKQYKTSNLPANAKKVYDELCANGISTSHIESSDIAGINKAIEPYKNEVLKMSEANPHGRNAIDIPKRSEHWNIMMKNFRSSGFLEGASAFYGSELFISGCGLELSTEKQTWWRNCYSDIGLETTPCAYMHNDYDFDYVKSLVYLSDVEKDTGPFSYIPESHLWQREHSLSFFIKETEMQLNNYAKSKGIGKANYYRRAMGVPEGREIFFSLPTLFQQLSHFGDDILPDTELSRELMEKEFQLTSDKGNFAFFTGGTGIHRGSNVYRGHRWAFQITLSKNPGLKKKLTNASRNLVASTLKNVIGEKEMLKLQKKFKATF